MQVEPLVATGVIVDQIGTPRSDGTRGSGLYAVPIKLNRRPDDLEVSLLRGVWENPPIHSMMHRSGILRVEGDSVVLDGTTVDEVEQYHARTLATVLRQVNALAAEARERQANEDDQAARAEAGYRQHVEEVAGRIKFDD